uniref:Uncharacterized protein n=1 Tax=Amphiprion ocellaris TaxID=80972 RepID=A0A3Q1C7R7_AMPOC
MYPSSEADLAYVADSVLLGVDLGADPSPATAGLDDGVGRRGRNLIIVSIDQFVNLPVVFHQTVERIFIVRRERCGEVLQHVVPAATRKEKVKIQSASLYVKLPLDNLLFNGMESAPL